MSKKKISQIGQATVATVVGSQSNPSLPGSTCSLPTILQPIWEIAISFKSLHLKVQLDREPLNEQEELDPVAQAFKSVQGNDKEDTQNGKCADVMSGLSCLMDCSHDTFRQFDGVECSDRERRQITKLFDRYFESSEDVEIIREVTNHPWIANNIIYWHVCAEDLEEEDNDDSTLALAWLCNLHAETTASKKIGFRKTFAEYDDEPLLDRVRELRDELFQQSPQGAGVMP